MKEHDTEIRRTAAFALAQLGDSLKTLQPQQMREVADAARHDTDAQVRQLLGYAVGYIGVAARQSDGAGPSSVTANGSRDIVANNQTTDLPVPGITKNLVRSGAGAKNDRSWIAETMSVHNAYRALHGAPPLEWDAELASKAQLAADECAARNMLHHSHCKEYGHGQNAFGGTPGAYGAKDAVDSWYNELTSPGYTWDRYGSPNGCPGCGHFTQVVWKDCAKVGMACDAQGKGYIVANYWPPGNMMGNYQNEVFPAGTEAKERVNMRTEPFTGEVVDGQVELTQILSTLEASGSPIAANIKSYLASGAKVALDFKPNPNGSLKYEYSTSDGSMGSGSCTF